VSSRGSTAGSRKSGQCLNRWIPRSSRGMTGWRGACSIHVHLRVPLERPDLSFALRPDLEREAQVFGVAELELADVVHGFALADLSEIDGLVLAQQVGLAAVHLGGDRRGGAARQFLQHRDIEEAAAL